MCTTHLERLGVKGLEGDQLSVDEAVLANRHVALLDSSLLGHNADNVHPGQGRLCQQGRDWHRQWWCARREMPGAHAWLTLSSP